MSRKTSIWLDCDTGHDDAFAILLAARHPECTLLGVSTVYGNAPLPKTTYNTQAILEAIGRSDIPVYVGAARPFCRDIACAPDIHGASGLDGTSHLPVPKVSVRENPGLQAMYETLSNTQPNTAWIVATGPLTNVALLFSIYPGIANHIAGLSIMGGAVGNGFTDASLGRDSRIGNWTPWAEFNIYVDPESARAVFENPALVDKTILVPLDLTHQFIATKNVQEMMLYGKQTDVKTSSATRTLFYEILTFFAKTYAHVFGLAAGPPLHDPLAVAAILAPHLFDLGVAEQWTVRVVTDGAHGATKEVRNGSSQCGRTMVVACEHGNKGVKIPRMLEVDALWQMLDECLERVESDVKV